MTPGDLRERVDALEQRVDDIETTAADQQGREWSVGDLMSEFQLSRRQALAAFGLLVAGYPLANALTRSVSAGTGEAGQLGSQNYPQDIWAEDIYDKNDNPVAELPGDGSLNIPTLTGTDLQYDSVNIDKASIGQAVGRGELATDQTIQTDTFTQVNIGTADIEHSDILTVDTANNKITVTADGTYLINCQISWNGSADWTSGDRCIALVKSGTTSRAQNTKMHVGANEILSQIGTGLTTITENTDIWAQARQDSGVNQTLLSGAGQNTFIEVIRIG